MCLKENFEFRLYVSGNTQNSIEAIANLTLFCQTYLKDRHKIEVIDVFKEPTRTLEDGIFMTPTLTKLFPSPSIRIVGTLSQTHVLIRTLGLSVQTA